MHLKNTKIITGLAMAAGIVSAHGANLVTPGGMIGTIGYTFTGNVATEAGDGAGEDLRFTSNSGGTFTITFTAPVDITIFNTEIFQGNNFDGQTGGPSADVSAMTVAGSTGWSYAPGTLDLTPVVGGLGSNNFTIGNARIFEGEPGAAAPPSNAPRSESDWGTFAIEGITSLTYAFSDAANFDGFRIAAVESTVPEPSAFGLLGLAALGLGLRRRR